MTITRDVILDLLPLYQEGEGSPATRLLVEQYLESDPDLKRILAAARPRRLAVSAPAPPDAALESLLRAKAELAKQKWLQIATVFLTLLPFSFMMQRGELKYLLIRDAPLSVIPLWAGAALGWYFYFKRRRPV
ncbi:MAG: hypothetical protein FJW30_01800 [Acidobacteria bacterium]|nr:hypothetical protein [Acidobacteriota bacterium]